MVVCHCHGVTDRDVRHAVRSGAATRGQLARTCKAGTGCGGCHPLIEEILESESPRPESGTSLCFATAG